MRTFLKVFAFNVVIIAFFLYVGNSIPQLRQDPPQELVLAADAPVEDFVKAGQDIFYGKGTCALCHEIGKKGERCPDLAGAGERAEARIKEARYKGKATNGAEYLVESLHEPTMYVVEGYQPSMPPLGRQFSDLEMVAVVAFLQSQGGEVTVNGQTRFPKWRGEGGGAAPAAAAPALPLRARRERLGRSWCSSGAVSRVINSMARRSCSGRACGILGLARMPTTSVRPFSNQTPWWWKVFHLD